MIPPPCRIRVRERERATARTPSSACSMRLSRAMCCALAGPLPAGCVFLDQAVGEARHPVARPEGRLAEPGPVAAEADGQGGGAVQVP
ncbi:hypothetical protein [Streptomyces sp. CBMA123]|uniref:hypothetical protein n=1 Tax=Streptomyces sp. CBMA123 TaxID=1896313 RepID=UPI001661BA25|nr:hypothetical protein [Streptomyces sp. CBMA123]